MFRFKKREIEDVEDNNSINLLISILVRYPEVTYVNFVPDDKTLRFTFMVKGSMSEPELKRFDDSLRKAIGVYSELIGENPSIIDIKCRLLNGITFIEVHRDVSTLTQEEISLIMGLSSDFFKDSLIRDHVEALIEEDKRAQEELIENMLEDLRASFRGRSLIGFREEGRVLVFNKNVRNSKS